MSTMDICRFHSSSWTRAIETRTNLWYSAGWNTIRTLSSFIVEKIYTWCRIFHKWNISQSIIFSFTVIGSLIFMYILFVRGRWLSYGIDPWSSDWGFIENLWSWHLVINLFMDNRSWQSLHCFLRKSTEGFCWFCRSWSCITPDLIDFNLLQFNNTWFTYLRRFHWDQRLRVFGFKHWIASFLSKIQALREIIVIIICFAPLCAIKVSGFHP